jgi:hypothetical protein
LVAFLCFWRYKLTVDKIPLAILFQKSAHLVMGPDNTLFLVGGDKLHASFFVSHASTEHFNDLQAQPLGIFHPSPGGLDIVIMAVIRMQGLMKKLSLSCPECTVSRSH